MPSLRISLPYARCSRMFRAFDTMAQGHEDHAQDRSSAGKEGIGDWAGSTGGES